MDFQEQFVRVVLNLIPVLQVASAQLSQLMSEEWHTPKGIRVAELSPVMKFELGPFERPDDHFYRNHRYLKAVNLKNKKIRERIAGIKDKKQAKGRKTGDQPIARRGNTKPINRRTRPDGVQTNEPPPEVLDALRRITAVREELKTVLASLKAEVRKVEAALAVEPLRKLLAVLETSLTGNGRRQLDPVNGNIFNGMNNITYNNRYQIENVFAINRLSARIESKLEGADAEIIKESTGHKMKGVLEETVNNSKGGGFPGGEQPSLRPEETDLLAQLQRNFSKVFAHQNVSLEQISQMSKIIDFVERYHGAVGGVKEHSREAEGAGGGRKVERGRGSRWRKVLWDERLELFGGGGEEEEEEEKKRGSMRRKGVEGC